MPTRWLPLSLLAMSLVAACSKENVVSVEEDNGGDPVEVADRPDCSAATAPAGATGAEMSAMGFPGATACYWIDVTEVTVAAYQAFLDAVGTTPPSSTSPCDWNESYEPDPTCAPQAGASDGLLPVVCVDWCDARDYCEWAGKRLCAGSYTWFDDAEQSEWFSACSNGDLSGYPYGDPYDAQVCNGDARAEGGTVAVGTRTACVTVDGVLDLSGNAAEWTAECNGESEPTDICKVRGGSYVSNSGELSCDASRSLDRNDAADWVGFRCCADAG